MADFSYEDFLSWNDPNQGDPWNSPMPADTPGWEEFTGWGGDETQQGWYQGADLDTSGGGGNWLQNLLGGAGGLAGSFLARVVLAARCSRPSAPSVGAPSGATRRTRRHGCSRKP